MCRSTMVATNCMRWMALPVCGTKRAWNPAMLKGKKRGKKKCSKGSASATRLTAGAHGPSLGNQSSSTSSALLPFYSLPDVAGSMFRSPSSPFPIGTDILQRPFARPQRVPVSRPPFQGQCSWPTTSLSHRTFTESVTVRCSGVPYLPPLPFGGSYAPLAQSVQPV